jgi:hypothetical protein
MKVATGSNRVTEKTTLVVARPQSVNIHWHIAKKSAYKTAITSINYPVLLNVQSIYSMKSNLRLKNFARASMIAIDGVVPG